MHTVYIIILDCGNTFHHPANYFLKIGGHLYSVSIETMYYSF